MSDAKMSGFWGVWCVHADGRRYWLGDSSQSRWTEEVAIGVAKHLGVGVDEGVYTAKPLPAASKERDPKAYRRGLVVAKGVAHDYLDGSDTYYFEINCEDDPACSETIVVSKGLYGDTCIAGLGHDAVLVYREDDEPFTEGG